MTAEWSFSWIWWITAVEVPVIGCLFWMIHHGRRESEQALLKVYREVQGNLNVVLENLAHSKLEVARLYATMADLKEVEKRLTDHLLRLEGRIGDALRQEPPSSQRSGCLLAERIQLLRARDHGDAA